MAKEIKAPYFDGTQVCAQVGGDLFFTDEATGTQQDMPFLRSLCGSCQFAKPCLEYALTHDVDGVWAGTTVTQRKNMRRRMGINTATYEYSRVR